jgi:hypothetical protein
VASAIAGPTDPHVAAAFYNPAALALLRGVHIWIDGGPRLHLGSIALQGGSTSINYTDFDAFAGVAWDLRSDRVTIAMAAFTPFTELARFNGDATRFYAREQTFAMFQQTFAVAVKIVSRWFVGASFNSAEMWLRHRYARDAALDLGRRDPSLAQEIDLFAFQFGFGFSVSTLIRPIDRLWIGISAQSQFFTPDAGDDIPLQGEQGATVRPCASTDGICRGNVRLAMRLPWIVHLGFRIEATPRIDVAAALRYINYGARPTLDLALQGGDLARASPTLLPEQKIDRGLQDAWGIEASARFRVGDKLRLAPSLMFETSAVQASAVTPSTLDAPKLDFTLLLEWRPIRRLRLGAHLGGTAYFIGDVLSRFNADDRVTCVEKAYSLDEKACQEVQAGRGLPSASGDYTIFVLHLGAALGVDL